MKKYEARVFRKNESKYSRIAHITYETFMRLTEQVNYSTINKRSYNNFIGFILIVKEREDDFTADPVVHIDI